MKKGFYGCKIFRESDDKIIEDTIHNCLVKMPSIEIVHMNTVVEKVEGINYLTVVVIYKVVG